MKVIIRPTTTSTTPAEDTTVVHDILEIKQEVNIEWILLDWDNSETQEQHLYALRHQSATSLLPIFCSLPSKSLLSETLSDGFSFDATQRQHKADIINRMLDELKENGSDDDPEFRFLTFLLTRPEVRLTFYLDISLPQLVRYPLMEVFIHDTHTALQRVNALDERGILISDRVEDEVQVCPYCKNSLINYKNICPQCQSVDIKRQRFLHCFSCGNTGPEQDFLKNDAIICANCNTKLRHIGIDYDRPLEEYCCNDYKHSFMEPEVCSHCLSCHKEFSPEHLISHKLSAYRLSDKGVNFIINKGALDLGDLKDEHSFFDPSFFMLFLDWMMHACIRYDYMSFTVFNIAIANNTQLLEAYGVIKTRQLCDDFFNFLRSYFRNTDIFTRRQNEVATVLFTQTSSKEIEPIIKNIKRFIEEAQEESVKIAVAMHTLSSDNIELSKYDAKLLLAELDGQTGDD